MRVTAELIIEPSYDAILTIIVHVALTFGVARSIIIVKPIGTIMAQIP